MIKNIRTKIFSFFQENNSKINLPIIGEVEFEKIDDIHYKYNLIKEDCVMDYSEFQIEIYLNQIGNKAINDISKLLLGLEGIYDSCKNAYLDDFNNEEDAEYIDGIIKQFTSESEFLQIIKTISQKERILAALKIALVKIYEKEDGFTITLDYMYGNEILLTFESNEKLKLINLKVTPNSLLCKKQFSDFISKFEESDVIEICGRFSNEWYNQPIKSYYIYSMSKRLKNIN